MKVKRRRFQRISIKSDTKAPQEPLFKHQFLIISIAVLVIVVSAISGSFAVFSQVSTGDEYNVIQVGDLELSYVDLDDKGNELELVSQYPIEDAEGQEGKPYRFSVQNTGTLVEKYTIKIVPDEDVITADGCKEKLLNTDYLRYSFDNKEANDLKDVKNVKNVENTEQEEYTIFSSSLEPFDMNIHEIRLWIKNDRNRTRRRK